MPEEEMALLAFFIKRFAEDAGDAGEFLAFNENP